MTLKLFSIFRTCKSDKRRPLSTDYPNLCPTLEMVPNAADYCNSQNRSVHLVVYKNISYSPEVFTKIRNSNFYEFVKNCFAEKIDQK